MKYKGQNEYAEQVKAYGYVGNAKNLMDLTSKFFSTGGVQNQLHLLNHIIASATLLREECIRTLIEQPDVDEKKRKRYRWVTR